MTAALYDGDERHEAQADRRARVGSCVTVEDGGLTEWWRIVPDSEADASRRLLWERTPVARAVLGHRAGDVVSVRAPSGTWPVMVLAVDEDGGRERRPRSGGRPAALGAGNADVPDAGDHGRPGIGRGAGVRRHPQLGR